MPILNVAFEAEARSTWLAALHQLALVDGDFDPEEQRQLAEQLNDDCPLQDFDWKHWRAPDLDEISRLFSSDPNSGEQFLRSAVVVALADGHLSQSELDLLQTWAEALGLKSELISSLVPCSTRVAQPWKPLDPLEDCLLHRSLDSCSMSV
jgi:tellurite resistance protein